MIQLGERSNNLDAEFITLGVASILIFALGCTPALLANRSVANRYPFTVKSTNRVLLWLGLLTGLCYIILLAPTAMHPGLLLTTLSGHAVSRKNLSQAIDRVPGVTSFVQAELLFFALYGLASSKKYSVPIWSINRRMLTVLCVGVVLRAAVASERLALIEVLICFWLPRVVFTWRPSFVRSALPILGLAAVFVIFGAGEYTRTWHHYKAYYSSFPEFLSVRFLGYFATSLNNGAGVYQQHGPFYFPTGTVDGLYKILRIFGYKQDPFGDVFNSYLEEFQTAEFNNPGGLYVPYIDYGIIGGALTFLTMGFLSAQLYRAFMRRSRLGILLYPGWYMAMLDLLRGWIWGSSRFLPVIGLALIAAYFLTEATKVSNGVDAHVEGLGPEPVAAGRG